MKLSMLRNRRLSPVTLLAAVALLGAPACDKDSSGGGAADVVQGEDTAGGQDVGSGDDGTSGGDVQGSDTASGADAGGDAAAGTDSVAGEDVAAGEDVETPDDTGTGGVTTLQSSLTREMSPAVPAADQTALAQGNTAFAIDLYHQIATEPGNLFFSPASVSIALAMTYAGAVGDTASQMAATMHYDIPAAQLHPAFNWLDLELNSRGEGAQGADGEEFRLHVVNRIWGQKDYGFLGSFLDTLAVNYGAGLAVLDFLADAEAARLVINAWVSEQTEDRIPELIPAGLLTESTVLVLTNAVYFNAAWKLKFDEEYTEAAPFHLLDGGTVDVPLMSQSESFPYVDAADYQAVELPYDGDELSMVIVAPKEGSFATFEAGLTPQVLDGIIGSLQTESIWLLMPRFEVSSEAMLGKTLQGMGMTDAFQYGLADFSGMDGTTQLFIAEVIHKAFVKVNEAGTEAAAATAVVVVGGGIPTEVRIDRPFLFLIRDIQTGTVLFLGRVVDPS